MIEFGDASYYIDVLAINKHIEIVSSEPISKVKKREVINENGKINGTIITTKTTKKEKIVDTIKYDMIKMFIEIIVDSTDMDDGSLGVDRALQNTNFSYQLAFNTLLHMGIIKEKK
jgi:hypothetical protein